MTKENTYDLAILGAGGVGLAASMYAARLALKTVVFGFSHGSELPVGGVITTTNNVENYPGFIKLTGQELAKKIEDHAREYDLVTIKQEKATDVTKTNSGFHVVTPKGEYDCKVLIFATGSKWRKLEVPGGKEFERKGVNYCALCDAPLFKDKIVAVVGGSDAAAKDALVLAEHAKKVYIIYRKEEIRADPINKKRVEDNKKIEIINNTNIVEVKGDVMVNGVVLDKEYNGSREFKLDGVFVAIGHIPLSDLAKPLGVKLNEKNEIIIDHKTSKTNVDGILAAGDITDKEFKQLITGVGDGCTAAYYAAQYISQKNHA